VAKTSQNKRLNELSDTEKLVLVLYYSSNQEIKGRTRLEKIVYLAKETGDANFSYYFMPYYFGPYSADLMNDVKALKRFRQVSEKSIPLDEERTVYSYSLTDEGLELAQKIEREVDKKDLAKFKEFIQKTSRRKTNVLIALSKFRLYRNLMKKLK